MIVPLVITDRIAELVRELEGIETQKAVLAE
jgi:hypothetical protein